MRPSVPDVRITDSQDDELSVYRSVSGQAVVALIFGLLAPAAFLGRALWAVPAIGVLISLGALRRIRRNEPAMVGRRLALVGLAFALLFGIAAPTNWLVHRIRVRGEATRLAAQWRRYISDDEPEKAFQLTLPTARRQPLDDNLKAVYRNDQRMRQELDAYLGGGRFGETSVVRTLLDVGPKAQVTFDETASQTQSAREDTVEQIFTVTYEEGGERKSLHVSLLMIRTNFPDGTAEWRIARTATAKPGDL
ncbi:MAG: hypothetical protein ABFC96_03590 [Thermoguttaceae bacterium]